MKKKKLLSEFLWRSDGDHVRLSHTCLRFVIFHLHQGEIERAWEWANFGGNEVYSYDGLQALAFFYLQSEEYHDALTYYKKIEERYNNKSDHYYAFLLDITSEFAADHGLTKERNELIQNLFPKGFEKYEELPTEPPTKGLVVKDVFEDEYKPEDHPLKKGDIIVAVSGIGVYEEDQLYYLKVLGGWGKYKTIVYRPTSKKYYEYIIDNHRQLFYIYIAPYPEVD